MTRKDYLNDPSAPHPNNIVVACSVFVQDQEGRILMIRRSDNGLYSIPGGGLEVPESLTECAIREVKEETGIDITIERLVGIYSNPDHIISYADGEVRQEFSVCFAGRSIGGKIETSKESSDVLWVDAELLSSLKIHDSTRLRLDHALANRSTPYYT